MSEIRGNAFFNSETLRKFKRECKELSKQMMASRIKRAVQLEEIAAKRPILVF